MKVLLIDDHALFRDGLMLVLEGLHLDIEICEAGSYEAARDILEVDTDFDLILLDLGLPGVGYIEALRAVRAYLPDTAIVVLSATEDVHMVEQVLHYGARGYIPKSLPAKIMLNALHLVISGGIYVPPEILRRESSSMLTPIVNNDCMEEKLTPRQCDVLYQLAEGKSNKEIGSTLDLTESTVRAHVAAILKSFGVSNRTQAVQYAMQKSWLKIHSN